MRALEEKVEKGNSLIKDSVCESQIKMEDEFVKLWSTLESKQEIMEKELSNTKQ